MMFALNTVTASKVGVLSVPKVLMTIQWRWYNWILFSFRSWAGEILVLLPSMLCQAIMSWDMRLKIELQLIIAFNSKQLKPKKMCTSWKRCDPQFFGQLWTIATTLTSGDTLAKDIIASNANIVSTGLLLFPGLFYAGSSSSKYVLFCGNCNI